MGSPPQVRGKLLGNDIPEELEGITPAGAGKTCFFINDLYRFKDHPRRCGENLYLQTYRQSRKGSPPQVRGKLAKSEQILNDYRITPAGAGKTQL